MPGATVILLSSLLATSNPVLTEEFGVGSNFMAETQAPQLTVKRNFYYSGKSEGFLPPLTQRNSSLTRSIGNSRFGPPTFSRGSTLPPRQTNPFPSAPSRFSRPSFSAR
ncbi:MAG: hypothetical protein MI743_07570 [Sneathiellales bacterium]|nr:hypothetical protein [Sneathiellales bacterium]